MELLCNTKLTHTRALDFSEAKKNVDLLTQLYTSCLCAFHFMTDTRNRIVRPANHYQIEAANFFVIAGEAFEIKRGSHSINFPIKVKHLKWST